DHRAPARAGQLPADGLFGGVDQAGWAAPPVPAADAAGEGQGAGAVAGGLARRQGVVLGAGAEQGRGGFADRRAGVVAVGQQVTGRGEVGDLVVEQALVEGGDAVEGGGGPPAGRPVRVGESPRGRRCRRQEWFGGEFGGLRGVVQREGDGLAVDSPQPVLGGGQVVQDRGGGALPGQQAPAQVTTHHLEDGGVKGGRRVGDGGRAGWGDAPPAGGEAPHEHGVRHQLALDSPVSAGAWASALSAFFTRVRWSSTTERA